VIEVIDKNLPPTLGPRGGKHPTKVRVVHSDCLTRRCYHPCQDKGSFTQGRGYTSYYKNPKWVCMRNYLHGCPDEGEF
jgi:hypothetical protein